MYWKLLKDMKKYVYDSIEEMWKKGGYENNQK